MTKGGKISEKSKNQAKKKPVAKTSLKVKVFRTAKSKNLGKEVVKQAVIHNHAPKNQEKADSFSEKEKASLKQAHEKKESVEKFGKENKARILYEKVEKDKLFIIRAGVTLIMTAIVIAWIFTLKSTIKVADNSGIDLSAIDDIKEMTESVSEKIEQINSDLKKVQSFGTSTVEKNEALEQATSSDRSPFEEASSSLPLLMEKIKQKNEVASTSAIDVNDIKALKLRIEELEKQAQE